MRDEAKWDKTKLCESIWETKGDVREDIEIKEYMKDVCERQMEKRWEEKRHVKEIFFPWLVVLKL